MANIILDVGHPAHVHLFRNAARILMSQGHAVLFTALDREIILHLLDRYNLPHKVTYKRRQGKLALLAELMLRTLKTYQIARRFKADLFVSFGNPTVGVPAWLMRKPYIALTDTEHATEQHRLFKPFATLIATPSVFDKSLGPKQVHYDGYHELAFLHPEQFTPDPEKLASLDLKPDDRFFVVRFVAWRATHDVGQHGFTSQQKLSLLHLLSQHGKVLLSVEGDVAPELEPYVTPFPPEDIHHFLAFATLYVGEGASMASEAAVLGTPSVYVNTLSVGYCLDLQNTYHLLSWHTEGDSALKKVEELLATPNLKQTWLERRERMLSEKINTTTWLVDRINQLLEGGT